MRYDDLTGWLARHRDLEQALQHLRRVAPEADRERTSEALQALDARLRLHMAQEEEWLLPAYAPLAADLPDNASPRVLLADHDRIRALLDTLAGLVDPDGPDALLARAEALSLLAGVLEHHDRREATWFKPTLDAHVDAATRRAWLERFEREEDALPPLPSPELAPAPPPRWTASEPLRALALATAQDAPLGPIPVPAHPKGPRLHAACAALVEAVAAAPDLRARRDRLAELSDRLRLLRLVS